MKTREKRSIWPLVATFVVVAMLCTVVAWTGWFSADDATSTVASLNADLVADTVAETATAAKEGSSPWSTWQFYVFLIAGGAAAVMALLTARKYFADVLKAEPGNERMQEIAGAVRDGAMAYLVRQRNIVIPVLIVVGVLIAFGANYEYLSVDAKWAVIILLGFISGGICSFATGWAGMKTATSASGRTAWACSDSSDGLNKGLQVAFKAGSVMGLSVVGLGLAFVVAWLLILAMIAGDEPLLVGTNMLSFGMGASMVALFARVGGGIFTKAADVGGDLVGKVEAGIPEDDPRNPATIADNVGDNVGDVAGMGADLYESYVGSILAAIALAVPAAMAFGSDADVWAFIVAPIALAAGGIGLSIWATTLVKTREGASLKDLLHSLHKAVNLASAGMLGVGLLVCLLCFPGKIWWGMWLASAIGLGAGLIIAMGSERYTAYDYKPTQDIARASATGPATVIISGVAVGMMSTWIPIVVIAVSTALAYGLAGGFMDASLGLYGVAIAAVGMLSTLGVTLATDAYGPIADNAGGNAEMSGLPPEVREKTDALDSLGNTTAAIGKGFAIGSAALTALALISAYATSAQLRTSFDLTSMISLTDPMVIAGLFIGALLVFVFAAMTMTAVGDAALVMVEEVRRQFRAEPGIMEGTVKPDYARCVDISTTGALKKMVVPSLMAIIAPVLVGILFGVGGVLGMLGGGLACGFAVAIFMANAGGAWDNAKKWVEKGNMGGKYLKNEAGEFVNEKGEVVQTQEESKNPNHGATVIGDTVGDPFKDTSGPSLNILIKLLSMVSVATIAVTMAVNDGKGLFAYLKDLFN